MPDEQTKLTGEQLAQHPAFETAETRRLLDTTLKDLMGQKLVGLSIETDALKPLLGSLDASLLEGEKPEGKLSETPVGVLRYEEIEAEPSLLATAKLEGELFGVPVMSVKPTPESSKVPEKLTLLQEALAQRDRLTELQRRSFRYDG